MKYFGVLSLLIFVLTACGRFSTIRFTAQSGGETPCDPYSGPFGGGDGSVNSPYLICASDHLQQLYNFSDRKVVVALRADLEIENISVRAVIRWAGDFDGEYHEIKGYRGATPLFGEVSGVVRRLHLEGVRISANGDGVGAFASRVVETGRVEEVSADGEIESLFNDTGGLVGILAGTLSQAAFSGTVSGGQRVGGIVGNSSGLVDRVEMQGRVTGAFDSIGGVIGHQSLGRVSRSSAEAQVSGRNSVGGLIGYSQSAKVENSYVVGTVEGSSSVGGLIGQSSSTHFFCYAETSITAATQIGGLVGLVTGGNTASSYWNVELTPTGTVGTPKTGSELRSADTYWDWDFNGTWFFDSDGLPNLF